MNPYNPVTNPSEYQQWERLYGGTTSGTRDISAAGSDFSAPAPQTPEYTPPDLTPKTWKQVYASVAPGTMDEFMGWVSEYLDANTPTTKKKDVWGIIRNEPVSPTSESDPVVQKALQGAFSTAWDKYVGKYVANTPQYEQANQPQATPSTPDISSLVNTKYAPAYDTLMRDIMGAASARGGLDSGGLLTSLSKGTAMLNAQKAGEEIDWSKFLKSLELPTAQFNFAKDVQFPESKRQFNLGYGMDVNRYNQDVKRYDDTMKAMQDLYASQNKTNWYDPILQVLGYAAGGFAGGIGEAGAKKAAEKWF